MVPKIRFSFRVLMPAFIPKILGLFSLQLMQAKDAQSVPTKGAKRKPKIDPGVYNVVSKRNENR
jgi:hypothetical protein